MGLAAAGGATEGAPGRRDAGDRGSISGSSEPEETSHWLHEPHPCPKAMPTFESCLLPAKSDGRPHFPRVFSLYNLVRFDNIVI
jgi:hypothetical protein